MKPKISILKIQKNGTTFWFNLSSPGDNPLYGAEKQGKITVGQDAIEALINGVAHAVKNVNVAKNAANPFVTVGKGLYDTILSANRSEIEKLRLALKELNTPLLISTDAPEICWELFHDGDEFWCLKNEIGRRLFKIDVPPSGIPSRNQRLRCLMIADPNEDEEGWKLPGAAEEALKLRDWLSQKDVDCEDYLQGTEATFQAVFDRLLANRYDIIHYSGHIVFDDETSREFALRLNDGRLFPATEIRNHVKGSPIVFLNGCWGAGRVSTGDPVESMVGLTDAFLAVGAQVVISSLFEVSDAGAREFAEKFYAAVLKGETVGKAMQAARKYVKDKNEYGATWAGFVMYGDPCLRIKFDDDKLQKLLVEIELSRENFDNSCLRMVEQAFEYGSAGGVISSSHLFAALISGESSHFRDYLNKLGVRPEKLHDMFQRIFKSAGRPESPPVQMKFSDNFKKILELAWKTVQHDDREKITELDLVQGFVGIKGGESRDLLNELDIDHEDLSRLKRRPQQASSEAASEDHAAEIRIGPLSSANSTPEAWQILLRSAHLAGQTEDAPISTIHLFVSMLQQKDGALCRALQRFNLEPGHFLGTPDIKKNAFDTKFSKTIDRIGCSDSVGQILALAQKIAELENRPQITDADLLAAFVRHGGGQTGQWLQKKGVILEALISEVFQDNGEFEMSRFNSAAQHVIKSAAECARKKGHVIVGRRHLLYALLAREGGALQRLLHAQKKDASQLAELLFVSMPAGKDTTMPLEAKIANMSTGLLQIIAAAEAEMKIASEKQITEEMLLKACLADGGGETGQFLVKQGVKWSSLI